MLLSCLRLWEQGLVIAAEYKDETDGSSIGPWIELYKLGDVDGVRPLLPLNRSRQAPPCGLS